MVPKDQRETQRWRYMRRILIVALVANLIVAGAKLLYGEITGSLAMYSDGFHSLLDAGASAIGLIGVTLAKKPPDQSHPYGYERYESLTSLIIGGFLALAILRIVSGAWARFVEPQLPSVTWLSFAIIGVSIATSGFISWWERRRAVSLGSELIHADAIHTASDVAVSISVVGSLVGAALGVKVLDPLVAVGVAVILGWSAFGVLRTATRSLTDAAAVNLEKIVGAAKQVPGVQDCHAARARGPAGRVRVDLHVLVDGDMPVDQAHTITEAVAETVRTQVPGIADILIHIGPLRKHEERRLHAG
ncbi:MAG: cation diffusion facilitator family transporter [Dehalococcoidales bacterium]|nr:cation diffusion facilitator family transporter [Dehalococcoidales bacterium]